MVFSEKWGIIPACDVASLDELRHLVRSTRDLAFIQGYKIGMMLVVQYGIFKVAEVIRNHTERPIIYDHQKFGTDIPSICGGKAITRFKEAGVDALIIFPMAGVETLRSSVKACLENGIRPIIGGEMTHKGYLRTEGGYLNDDGPRKIYLDAARLAVRDYVIPGTKLEKMREYNVLISKYINTPSFFFPGIGKGQGGDIVSAFQTVFPNPSYAIVGRGIYAQEDPGAAAESLWNSVSESIEDI